MVCATYSTTDLRTDGLTFSEIYVRHLGLRSRKPVGLHDDPVAVLVGAW